MSSRFCSIESNEALGSAYRELQPEIDAAVARVLASGWYILGEEVAAFEAEYAAYCEALAWRRISNIRNTLVIHEKALREYLKGAP